MDLARAAPMAIDLEAELLAAYPALTRRLTLVVRDAADAEDALGGSNMKDTLLSQLAGSELGSVVFVRDYIQLVFEPGDGLLPDPRVLRPATEGRFATLSAFTVPTVLRGGRAIGRGDPGWRDGLCDLIGRRVRSAQSVDNALAVEFDSNDVARISLAPEDAVGPEFALLQLEDPDEWDVWRPGE